MRHVISAFLFLVCVVCAAAAQDPALVSVTPATGPTLGGTTVTITLTPGTFACGLDPCLGPQLVIGGIPVTYTSPNPTTIVAVTPPHAPGAVNIELRPGIGEIGTPSVLQNAFIFQGNDIPALSPHMFLLLLIGLAVWGGFATLRA
jgi:hypothetical protein